MITLMIFISYLVAGFFLVCFAKWSKWPELELERGEIPPVIFFWPIVWSLFLIFMAGSVIIQAIEKIAYKILDSMISYIDYVVDAANDLERRGKNGEPK